MVFYRKYRPQNFEELIGQEHVKTALINAGKAGKLGHAYLFTGPRGSGKTSTARILAKIVNCEKPESAILPCNECSACISITDGSNMDLIEIDAASNRGIDDIRDLRDRIKLAPSSLKKKVYIIDEVHMLTTEAFNALLKTLEEPPAHVLFILATTEVNKLPATILSRVQRFDFKLATGDQIKEALKNITGKEKLEISDEILSMIAESSEGSFRDAVKNLDQIASSGEINIESAKSLLKSNDFSELIGLLENISSNKTKEALELVSGINEKGASVKEFINSSLKLLRQILLIKNEVTDEVKADLGTGRWEKVSALSAKLSITQVVNYIENFHTSLEQLKFTNIPSLPLEVAVIKSSQPSVVSYQTSVVNQSPVIPSRSEESIQRKTDSSAAPLNDSQYDKNEQKHSEPIPSAETMQSSDDVIVITDKWTYILETIKPYNYSLEALLKQAKVVNCDGVSVVLEVPYSFHQRILEAPKSRTLLESILADVLGKSVRVSTVLGKREVNIEELANVEVAQDDEIVRLASEIFNS